MEEFIPSIPGYEILGELGRGGMGIVYKAHNLKYDRLVALKMILSGRGADAIELARFRIEAEAIGSLDHPNIVESHDVLHPRGTTSGNLRIAQGVGGP
jgi:serine/threonine protein kinase